MPNQNLNILQTSNQITFSDEQLAILQPQFTQPTLVNACAGAGKTTTLIMSILYQAMEGNVLPQNVLGITFSKKAQLDMADKYEDKYTRLIQDYQPQTNWKTPLFKTFHALFFQLLKMLYPTYQFNIINWQKYTKQLFQDIKKPMPALNERENVELYLRLSENLINSGMTYDGLTINQQNQRTAIILKNLQANNQVKNNDLTTLINYYGILDDDFIASYRQLIQHYHQLKQQQQEIDFNDMLAMLLNAVVSYPKYRQLVQQKLQNIHQVYLDEFQDISPLQWQLMSLILPTNVLNHIVVIGDDDQSIYAFRGSEPSFILNFKHKMPHAIQYNLSTNYRTKENILNLVKPMIQSNTLRLNKSLKAANPGGEIKTFVDQQQAAIKAFLTDMNQHPKQKYAVLARNNIDLSIIVDQLAESQHYFSYGQNNENVIYQNNKVYQNYYHLIHALYKDDFAEFVEYSNHLGFNYFKKWLTNYLNNFQKITEFLTSTTWYQDFNQIKSHRYEFKQIIRQLQTNYPQINEIINSNDEQSQQYVPTALFNLVDLLCENYYQYMLNHNYLGISKEEFVNFKEYFNRLITNSHSCNEFFVKEQTKKLAIENHQNEDNQFQAMTFHRSKGLEFDETLIYIGTGIISHAEMDLYDLFPASNTKNNTIQTVINQPMKSLAVMMANGLDSANLIIKNYQPDKKFWIPQASLTNAVQQVIKSDYHYLPKISLAKTINQNSHLQKLIYLECEQIAKSIEEERRLFYVGVTRAKNKVIFTLNHDALDENQTIPNSRIIKYANQSKHPITTNDLHLDLL